jgi:hypothetical protein
MCVYVYGYAYVYYTLKQSNDGYTDVTHLVGIAAGDHSPTYKRGPDQHRF